MRLASRASIAFLLCLALPGCYVKMHGVEVSGGGSVASTTSGRVGGTARLSGGNASFSSGSRVSPGASGGHVSLGRGASVVLVLGLVVADLVNSIVGPSAPTPLLADERIMETC